VSAILAKTNYPGYGYFVEKGCTTFPEMWEIDQPNSTVIHTSYTGVSALFFKGLSGINEFSSGYDTILIAPKAIECLSWCRAAINTPYGKVKSAWEKDKKGRIKYTFTIPFGTVAKLRMENEEEKIVSAGNYSFTFPADRQ
jgi:alpha-L-rhamnosidase